LSTNPYLLSLLNVKYLIFATADLYFNTASKDADKLTAMLAGTTIATEVVNIDGISFGLITNPLAPLPRHFLVERVTGVDEIPRLQADTLEARAHPAINGQDNATAPVLVREQANRLTSRSLAEDLRGTDAFDTTESFEVAYQGDVIDVHLTPSRRERFLVINERYHPN
jgi:hypothetical protein